MPENQEHGFVIGNLVISKGDTPSDPNKLPDIIPANTEVRFNRVRGQEIQHDPARIISYKQMVAKVLPNGDITGDLDEQGKIRVDEQGNVVSESGIWLAEGQYRVSISDGSFTSPKNNLVVTSEFTQENPLDIITAYDFVPGPGEAVQTIQLPPPSGPERVVGWDYEQARPGWYPIPKGDPGNPTAFELRGTGMPNGTVTADPGTYYTDSAGTNGAWRWLKKSGTGNTGWVCLIGDTGWRDISNQLPAGREKSSSNGACAIRRMGDQVYIEMNLNITSSASPTILLLPSGFGVLSGGPNVRRPLRMWRSTSANHVLPSIPDEVIYMNSSGYIAAGSNLTVPGTVAASGLWLTDSPWPTTLPGVPA